MINTLRRLSAGMVLLVLAFGAVACNDRSTDHATGGGSLHAYQQGRALVKESLAALGGIDALETAGTLVLIGEGTTDLSVRLQGLHPEQSNPVAAQETLAVDWSGDRLAYETHARVNPDADEWIRYVFDADDRMLIALRLSGQAFWTGTNADHKRRYRRMVPHVLLHEALSQRRTLRHVGRVEGEEVVTVTLPEGTVLSLGIDPEADLLGSVEYVHSLPVHGDMRVRWEFNDYQSVDGLGPYPTRYRIEVGDRVLKEIRYTSVKTGAGHENLFGAPAGIDVPPPPPIEQDAPSTEPNETPDDAPSLPRVRTVADGVHLAVNVRSGFHHLFVEFADFVMVVDAPAGYHELQMIPPVDWGGDVSPSAVSRRLLDAVQSTVPDKPVRYVAITHHHGDHVGGVRPFIEAGATILASPTTVPVIEAAAESPFTLEPDGLTGRPGRPTIETVEEERTISDGTRSVQLLDVGSNPHAEGMLVVYVPGEQMLYQSDLFMPSSNGFPDPARIPVMKWFVDWLDRSDLEVETIYAVHGSARVTDEQLAAIRGLEASARTSSAARMTGTSAPETRN